MRWVRKGTPERPQSDWANLKKSPGTWKAKFLPCEGKKSTGSGFTGSVREGCGKLP